MTFIPFTAKTRMSGVDWDGNEIPQGRRRCRPAVRHRSRRQLHQSLRRGGQCRLQPGGTPLVVAKNHRILGVIHLKDIVKKGVRDRFADLRKMGIRPL